MYEQADKKIYGYEIEKIKNVGFIFLNILLIIVSIIVFLNVKIKYKKY